MGINSLLRRLFLAALGMMCIASSAPAATLISFKPVPVSPALNEFDFGGGPIPDFEEGPGMIGNGDGTLPLASQGLPGLQIDTPLTVPAIPGGNINGDGSTTFYDVSFDITGLFASAPAVLVGGPGGTIVQTLGGVTPTFTITSTDPPGVGLPVLLLSGTISVATITGTDGGNAGATFSSGGITYTGGAIFAALLSAGGTANPGSMSFSLTDVSPSFSIGATFLNVFTANGEGSFTAPVVPEPAAISLAGLALLMLKRRK